MVRSPLCDIDHQKTSFSIFIFVVDEKENYIQTVENLIIQKPIWSDNEKAVYFIFVAIFILYLC